MFKLNVQNQFWYYAIHYAPKLGFYFPSNIAISVTERCNLNCVYCARTTIPLCEDMPFNHYRHILRSMPYLLDGVNLIGLGEQLLYPSIVELLDLTIEERKRNVILSTNGMVDLSEKMIQSLLKCRQVQFSLDTVNQNVLSKTRRGAKVSVIERNLTRLLSAKSGKKPVININSVIHGDNISGIEGMLEFVESLPIGLDYVQFNSVSLTDYQDAYRPLPLESSKYESYVKHLKSLAEKSSVKVIGLDSMLKFGNDPSRCAIPKFGMGIRPNGDVYGCCYLPTYKLGNAFSDGILRSWNSKTARSFRKRVYGKNPPSVCRFCNFAQNY